MVGLDAAGKVRSRTFELNCVNLCIVNMCR
jgi:hypothetical protein